MATLSLTERLSLVVLDVCLDLVVTAVEALVLARDGLRALKARLRRRARRRRP